MTLSYTVQWYMAVRVYENGKDLWCLLKSRLFQFPNKGLLLCGLRADYPTFSVKRVYYSTIKGWLSRSFVETVYYSLIRGWLICLPIKEHRVTNLKRVLICTPACQNFQKSYKVMYVYVVDKIEIQSNLKFAQSKLKF
jgi:hypothetical protein